MAGRCKDENYFSYSIRCMRQLATLYLDMKHREKEAGVYLAFSTLLFIQYETPAYETLSSTFKLVLPSSVKYLCKRPTVQTKFSHGDNEDEHLKAICVNLILKHVNFNP